MLENTWMSKSTHMSHSLHFLLVETWSDKWQFVRSYLYINTIPVNVSKVSYANFEVQQFCVCVCVFFKEICYAHQGCIYLIENMVNRKLLLQFKIYIFYFSIF